MKESEIDQIVAALSSRDLVCRSLVVAADAKSSQACRIVCPANAGPAISMQDGLLEATLMPSLVRLESKASKLSITPYGATYDLGGERKWLLPFLPSAIVSSVRDWLASTWRSLSKQGAAASAAPQQ